MAYLLSDTVDALDLSAFYEPYEGDGRRNSPYDPRMMVKLLLYGYATGVFSSRKIAKKLHEDVAFWVLAGENFPAHRTLAEFRQRHLPVFQSLFVQVLEVAREAGLLRMGTVAVDGTKVKASASKRKAMSYGRMTQDRERPLSDSYHHPRHAPVPCAAHRVPRRRRRVARLRASKHRCRRRRSPGFPPLPIPTIGEHSAVRHHQAT